jgi:hypothetical protein
MASFSSNKIKFSNTGIGDAFSSARSCRNLTIKEAAGLVGINANYLSAMEAGRFHDLPKGLYQKKYIKEYAAFLGLEQDRIVEDLGENGFLDCHSETKMFSRKVINNKTLIVPRIFKNLAIMGVVLVCFAYLFNKFENIAKPPSLQVVYPVENLITAERNIDIKGVTEAETQVTINGNQVLSDNKGNFNKVINLRGGMNTITIKARKKFGNEMTVVKQVLVKE